MDLRTNRRQSDAGACDPAVGSAAGCSDPGPTSPSSSSDCGSITSPTKKCVNRQSQRCSVCGDRAYYVFYGAVACDSCRTFFRRQVLHAKDLSCHFSYTCQIQQNTRKDCASCRLDKCLAVGMKKSLVAVGEVESTRSPGSCRSSTSQQQAALPAATAATEAAARDVMLFRSKSASEIPAALLQNPIHLSGSRASVVLMTQGIAGGASFAGSTLQPVDRIDASSPTQYRDYHCHQDSVRRCRSLIPRGTFLSMSDVYDGNCGAMNLKLERDEHPSFGSQDPVSLTNSVSDHASAIICPENSRASRVPILAARLSPPPKLHPKIAFKKSIDKSSKTGQTSESLTPKIEKNGLPFETSDDSSGSEPGRSEQAVIREATDHRSKATRKLIHLKRRNPPVSLTIDLGSNQVIHVMDLSSTERQRFVEIMDATKCLEKGMGRDFRKWTEDIRRQEKETSFIPTVILVCAKMLMSIAEKLAVYSLLPHQDKEILLKGSLTEILFLRSAKFFSPSHRCWIFGSGDSECVIPDVVPIKVLQVASQDVYDRYSNFVSTFDPELFDGVICNLMCVICFLTERSDPLIHKSHISSERSLYLRLLNRYLEAKYAAGSKLSPEEAFANIQAKLNELTSIKEIYERSNVDLDNIDQLVLNYQQMRLGSPPLASESLCHGDGDAHVPASHTLTSPS